MTQQEKAYEQYCNLHRQFMDEYKVISVHVAELYQMPKKFIEENAAAMDRYMAESSVPGSPDSSDGSVRGVKDFIYRIEDFKLQIMGLFFEHRALIEKCSVYMHKVQQLKFTRFNAETEQKFIELIPELTSLRFGLKCIEEKAGGMVGRLENVEGKWKIINKKMAA